MDAKMVFKSESAVAFFKELVDEAINHQHLHARELTEFYVVNLLSSFLQRPESDSEPLALQLARSLEVGGVQERRTLRRIGDLSLFVSGFFSESLRRKLVDVDYYVQIGGYAYSSLARLESASFAEMYKELSDKFVPFVDVLSEVSERTSCASNSELLRLYEKWLLTGSRRTGRLLTEKGVIPNSSARSKFVQ